MGKKKPYIPAPRLSRYRISCHQIEGLASMRWKKAKVEGNEVVLNEAFPSTKETKRRQWFPPVKGDNSKKIREFIVVSQAGRKLIGSEHQISVRGGEGI